MNSSDSDSDPKDSVTAVADQSFVRERPPDIERGTVLAARYQIEEIVGKGGSGVVLRVFDRTAQMVVALKVLKSELARDSKWEKRFSRELRLARPIQHPNVCRIFDIGEADGHRFLTMELARGGSLRDELKRGLSSVRPFSARMADAEAVIAGLAAIHMAGIVHRDFKPDNLLRMEDGRLVLSDFGLATDAANAPDATVLIGTPHYMAPEVLAGEPATTRSDVWALGVVLHEIFFERRPERRAVSFDGSGKAPLRPESLVERDMLALCEQCLSESPLDRPENAGAVTALFETARSRPGHLERARRRNYVRGVLMLLLVLAAGIGVARRTFQRRRVVADAAPPSGIVRLAPVGRPADWRKVATLVTAVSGHVDCFSILNDKTVRLIWGTPRHAEDVEIATGTRRPAHLVPETYAIDCPEPSPDRNRMLFTARNGSGATEIRLSNHTDGSGAATIVSGFEPVWLSNGDDFVYNVDSFHAAVFVLPTSTSNLLSEPDPAEHRPILQKTASSATGGDVALLFGSNRSERLVAIYGGSELALRKSFVVPGGYEIRFDRETDRVLISCQLSAAVSSLTELDWKNAVLRNVGTYAGLDLIAAARGSNEIVVLGRHRSKDVWVYGDGIPRRLTSDGENFSADISPSGDLLLSKRSGDGSVSIWWKGHDGSTKQVSSGPADVMPQFSRDGRRWLYADYVRKSIMRCSVETDHCEVLRHDESLPSWPRFSPDGNAVAYLTQMNVPKLMVVSLDGREVREIGDTYDQCPPVWSSQNSLWNFESAAGHHFWSERNATTGGKTGRRLEVKGVEINTSQASTDEAQCWPPNVGTDSPFFQRVRVETEETSRLLRFAPTAIGE